MMLTVNQNEGDRPSKTYKKFTKQDNQTLLSLHQELSRFYKASELWKVIGQRMGRTARNVRDHYKKFASQSNDSWTEEEDQLIMRKVAEIGRKWADIAGLLKNRSSQNVYTRYRNLMSKTRTKYRGTQVISRQALPVLAPVKLPHPIPETNIFASFDNGNAPQAELNIFPSFDNGNHQQILWDASLYQYQYPPLNDQMLVGLQRKSEAPLQEIIEQSDSFDEEFVVDETPQF